MTTAMQTLVQRKEVDRSARMRQNVITMWKSIRALFSPAGGSVETEDRAADTKLGLLWISLVRLGMARGLTLQAAEDLAQESIVAGMESFDPARGDFSAFCKTIMANKAKNLHRDKKSHEPIPEDGGTFVDPGGGPGWTSYHRQCQERADRIVSNTISSLADEEADFFLVLAEVHGEQYHGEVSEAARRAGITPQKGWDIFRKIQRQFKDLDREILLPERPPERINDPSTRWSLGRSMSDSPVGGSSPATFCAPSDIDSSSASHLSGFQGRYRRFSAGLRPRTLRKLRGLLKQ